MDEEILLDREAALKHVQGDEEFLQEIYEIFLEEIPERLESFHAAFENNEIEKIVGLAHSLKGVSLTIGAMGCHKTAEKMEMAARAGDFAATEAEFKKIKKNLKKLEKELTTLTK